MVLTQRFRDELRKQAREEGFAQGREEGRKQAREDGFALGREEERRAWVEWYQRSQQALAEGREFTEPPPSEK